MLHCKPRLEKNRLNLYLTCAGVASACVKLKGNTWQKFAEEQLRPLSGAKTTGQTCRQLPVTRNQHFPFQDSVFSLFKSKLIVLKIKMALYCTAAGQWYAPSAVINDAWYCMVLQGIAWYYIALRGRAHIT